MLTIRGSPRRRTPRRRSSSTRRSCPTRACGHVVDRVGGAQVGGRGVRHAVGVHGEQRVASVVASRPIGGMPHNSPASRPAFVANAPTAPQLELGMVQDRSQGRCRRCRCSTGSRDRACASVPQVRALRQDSALRRVMTWENGLVVEGEAPMANPTRSSGCACGAVQVEITGDPTVMAYCHCSSCRGWLGAPIHAASLWPAASVRVVKGADKLGLYKKTEASHRQFCTECGGPVWSATRDRARPTSPRGRSGTRVQADPARPLRREGAGGARRAAEVQGLPEGLRRFGRHARGVTLFGSGWRCTLPATIPPPRRQGDAGRQDAGSAEGANVVRDDPV